MSIKNLGFIEGMIIGSYMPDAPGGHKYMDWEKAEKICLEHPDRIVFAGLREDWGCTSGIIYNNGKFCDGGGIFGNSRWATPILCIGGKEIECWTHKKHEGNKVPKWWGRGASLKSGDPWDLEDDEDE